MSIRTVSTCAVAAVICALLSNLAMGCSGTEPVGPALLDAHHDVSEGG